MEKIYHEQHCLNSLLQGPYFSVESLAEIAHNLDDKERKARNSWWADCLNTDESGNFSVQVIAMALQNLGLELVPYMQKSEEAEAARADPTSQRAFICHFDMHWLAIRRLGYQWFDLNSLYSQPRLISNTYLSIYLAQLNSEKYSIWFVTGHLPECEADQYLMMHPISGTYLTQSGRSSDSREAEKDADLQRALALSLRDDFNDISLQSILAETRREAEELELQKALQISAQESYGRVNSSSCTDEQSR
ncbi:Ataxin-3 [Taenia crassiceps]|uniref:ubiquitinyl hydrolase 1 n=1 Tax=Taenia crassiceps TaxID=6207 RepID=A0ABR4QU89_9CEST